MNRFANALLLLTLTASAGADVFRWTDSNGVVHFSDRPHPGAQILNIPGSPPPGAANPDQKSEQIPNQTEEPAADSSEQEYQSVAITQPKQDETVRNNQGYVPIIIEVEPDLRPGDLFQVMLDGKAIGKPQPGKLFALNELDRGTHTVAVQIVGADGNVINTSDAVTFHMQRPRVGMVPGTKPPTGN